MGNNKKAQTDFPIHSLLENRWSPRAYLEAPIPEEKINALLEAARWAPSAFNEQPWRFILATDKQSDTYKKIFESLVEFNRIWVKPVPVLIVALAKKNYSHNGKPNTTAAYDLGQAVAHMTFQAMSEGLYAHQMGGFDKSNLKQLLHISDEYELFTVIALGYLGDPVTLPDDMRKTEQASRERKPLSELVI